LAIVINGAIAGEAIADLYRSDLAAAGIADGCCGFRFVLPAALSPVVAHRIEVRRACDGSLLHGAPITLRPSPRALPVTPPGN
jgi:hypothetical protein